MRWLWMPWSIVMIRLERKEGRFLSPLRELDWWPAGLNPDKIADH